MPTANPTARASPHFMARPIFASDVFYPEVSRWFIAFARPPISGRKCVCPAQMDDDLHEGNAQLVCRREAV